jgi:hypothetical protein
MRSGSSATTITSTRRRRGDEEMTQNHPSRIAAATFAVLALAAPAATARPIVDRPLDGPAEPAAAPPVSASEEGFDWGSAGVGAAAAGLILAAGGGLAAVHRGGLAKSVVDGQWARERACRGSK